MTIDKTMKRIAPVLASVLMGVMITACSHAAAHGEGVLKAEGAVRLARGGGVAISPGSSVRLAPGDDVTVSSGSAEVDLPGGGHLELRSGTSVRFQEGPQLEAGDLLVESSSRAPVRVGSAVGPVDVSGAARLRRDLAVKVGSYKGWATVAAGRTVTVAALQQDTVPAVGLVPDPSPLHLDASDPWDQRFLGTAIDLTTQLDSQSRYVTANTLPSEAETAAFYRRTIGPLAAVGVFDDALLDSALPSSLGVPSPGDALVAAAIALAGTGPFPDRWHEVFELRQQGAEWGIVVLDEHADPTRILRIVGAAVSKAALAPASPTIPRSVQVAQSYPGTPAAPTATASSPATVPANPAEAAAPVTATPGRAAAPTTPGPTTPGSPTHPASPTTTVPPTTIPAVMPQLGPVLDPVVNIIHALLGGTPTG